MNAWSKVNHFYTQIRQNIQPEVFVIPLFDADTEHQFWRERQADLRLTLTTMLLLGASVYLGFIALKLYADKLTLSDLPLRSIPALTLFSLAAILQFSDPVLQKIRLIAKIAVIISASSIMLTLKIDAQPQNYLESWTGLLAIYFVTYGQMYLSRNEAVIFGWLTMIAVSSCGYRIGVSLAELTPSVLILTVVNAFGYYTRCQLEIYARKAFKDRRQAETIATDQSLYLCHLSHNLRQIVQTISCYSSVLDNEIARSTSQELLQTSHKLGNAIDELNNAFNHILDLAHLETGKLSPHLSCVEINKLLATLETQFTPLAIKRGLHLKIRQRTRPPFFIHTDAHILHQILANLIDNAIKYTVSGWILVSSVKISATQIKLHVRDSGMGISEDLRENIFKEFYRGGRRRGDLDVFGLGIGLAYALKATQHLKHHYLDFRSRLNQGSDFTLTLPSTQLPKFNHPELSKHYDLAGSFILAVDDDYTVLHALSEQLRSWGCLVHQASSIAETIACLADTLRPPDLLITDFYLDNAETAHDIIAVIQADCGPVPTLILSAHAIPNDDKAKWSENTLLLRKPANAGLLMESMGKAMGKVTVS